MWVREQVLVGVWVHPWVRVWVCTLDRIPDMLLANKLITYHSMAKTQTQQRDRFLCPYSHTAMLSCQGVKNLCTMYLILLCKCK